MWLILVGENSKSAEGLWTWVMIMGVGTHTIVYIKIKIVLSKQSLMICVLNES